MQINADAAENAGIAGRLRSTKTNREEISLNCFHSRRFLRSVAFIAPGRIPKNEKPAHSAGLRQTLPFKNSGAGEGIRTLDPDLGKVVLYH